MWTSYIVKLDFTIFKERGVIVFHADVKFNLKDGGSNGQSILRFQLPIN